jgi:hypothetical protein
MTRRTDYGSSARRGAGSRVEFDCGRRVKTLTRLLGRPADLDLRVRIAALAAAGGLAYWMRDFVAARGAYEERLVLAEESGDRILEADAHYDFGFLGMVSQDDGMLRAHG